MASLRATGLLLCLLLVAPIEARPQIGWLTWGWAPGWFISSIQVLDTVNEGLDSVVDNGVGVNEKFKHTANQIEALVSSLEDLGTLFSFLLNAKKANRRDDLVDNIAAPTEDLVASLAEMDQLVGKIAKPVKQLMDNLPQPLKDLVDRSTSLEEALAEGLQDKIFN